MKSIFFTVSLFLAVAGSSQDMTKFKVYHPEANAKKEISDAVKQAKEAGKHVMIQIGGNWCVWCARFDEFVKNDQSLDSLLKADYIVYHLNYSKENKNTEVLSKYSFPQRFGFPVFIILNEKGDLIHTQNSAYLESGKSYDKEKVHGFFSDWRPKALDPAQYKEQ